jgi:hypothetical protein
MSREVWNDPLPGSPGKRLRTSDPLTEHDVAERIDRAALRLARILTDIRQQGGMEAVQRSRYLTNAVNILAAELEIWGIEPQRSWISQTSPGPSGMPALVEIPGTRSGGMADD